MQQPNAQAATGTRRIWHKTESRHVRRKDDGKYVCHIKTRHKHIMGADHNTLEEALAEFAELCEQHFAELRKQYGTGTHQSSAGNKRQRHAATPGHQPKDIEDMQNGVSEHHEPTPFQEAPCSRRQRTCSPVEAPATAETAAAAAAGAVDGLSLRPPAAEQLHCSQHTSKTSAGSGAEGSAAGRPSTARDAHCPVESPLAQTRAGQEELQGPAAVQAVAATAGDADCVDSCMVQISEAFDEVATAGYGSVRLLERIWQGAHSAVHKGQLIKQSQSNSAAVAGASDVPSGDAQGGVSSSCQVSFVAVKVFAPCMQPQLGGDCVCGPCCGFKQEHSALKLLRQRPTAACVRLLALGIVTRNGNQAVAAATAAPVRPDNAAMVGQSTGSSNAQMQLPERQCVVMELADGTLEGTESRSEQEASALMLPLVTTLAAMHSGHLGDDSNMRLVHRNIKPSNILLTKRGPVFCDFSCCAIFTVKGGAPELMYTRAGTELFMAPEVDTASDKGYTRDVDCYALGLVAASLLVGGSGALRERERKHPTLTLRGWLYDFCQGRGLLCEQGVSRQARDFVRCCCVLRQQPVELLQHEWLQGSSVRRMELRVFRKPRLPIAKQ